MIGSSTGACGRVTSLLTPILVAFDRSADYLLNGGVGFLNRCLNGRFETRCCGSACGGWRRF